MDLVVAVILWFVLLPLMAFTHGVPRIIFGVAVPLFVPGYLVIASLFPRRDSLDGLERPLLSFGLSLALLPLVALLLNFTSPGIGKVPVTVGLTLLVVGSAVTAWLRRGQLPPSERMGLRLKASLAAARGAGTTQYALGGLLFLSATVALTIAGYILLTPKPPVRYTEFYLKDVQGLLETRPIKVAPGEAVPLTLGITNHEGKEVGYRIDLAAPNEPVKDIARPRVAAGEKWEDKLGFALERVGNGQKVMFLLYREGDSQPYRTLYLWVDVRTLA